MRFYSNMHGINLIFNKIGQENINKQLVNVIRNNDQSGKLILKDDFHPLFIEFGTDSNDEIGEPKVISNTSPMIQRWEDTFNGIFKNDLINQNNKKTLKNSNLLEKQLTQKYQEKILDSELIHFE